jgi:single-strand DNA-binding protein
MFQQIMLVGNLGRDPEMRYTPSGVPVATFSMAVSRRWTGQDGQPQEKTVWFRITAWRRDAELVSQYLTKGRQVLVIGEIEEPTTWTDREGNTRASLEVTARTIRFIGGRGEGIGVGEEHAAAPAPAPAGRKGRSGNAPAPGNGPELTDDDIPF